MPSRPKRMRTRSTPKKGGKKGAKHLVNNHGTLVKAKLLTLLDRVAPDGSLNVKQIVWYLRARIPAFTTSETRMRAVLKVDRDVAAKWKKKTAGKGSKGQSVVRPDGSIVGECEVATAVCGRTATPTRIGGTATASQRVRLPGWSVIQVLLNASTEELDLLAMPADMLVRLAPTPAHVQRLGWSLGDLVVLAGVKRPNHQDECCEEGQTSGVWDRQGLVRAVLRIEAAHRRAEDRKDRDEFPSSYVFEGQYAARGAGGVCDSMNKINAWDAKYGSGALRSPEDKILSFMEMVDDVEVAHEAHRRQGDLVQFNRGVIKSLQDLKVGYGEDYVGAQTVRSCTAMHFPDTLTHPEHPLSSVLWADVVAVHPDQHGHGQKNSKVMGASATVADVGLAYGVSGWLVICMTCCLSALNKREVEQGLETLKEFAGAFSQDSGIPASPAVYSLWIQKKKKTWRSYLPGWSRVWAGEPM